MRSLFLTTALTALLALILSCNGVATNNSTGSTGTASGSPTEAYKALYAAVKSKDTEKIKAAMSKKTQEFAQMVSARNSTPVEKVFENGFTSTTFAESLPEIRDERVSGDFGAVEVWSAKDNRWEDLGFVNEGGSWKLAIGEMFAGTFKSPGKGRAIKEQEAANMANGNNMIPMIPTNGNANSNVKVIVPKERPQSSDNK